MQDAIVYVPHAGIDKQKWDACIHRAVNGLIYATSEYLDVMSPHWHALVMGDYEAVMPITWRNKMGFKYACQPAFAQQLGLFYTNETHSKLTPAFLEALSRRYKLIEIFLNHHNSVGTNNALHQNFVLDLRNDYDSIRSNYKNDLLKNLKRSEKFRLRYQPGDDATQAIELYRQYYANRMHIRPQDFNSLSKLATHFMKRHRAIVRNVCLPNGKLLATALFLKDEKRLYNIASTTLPDGRTMEANHFLMDELIKEFAGSGLILDFEGSDLPGVARFYQKFSPQSQPYSFYRTNRLPFWIKWLKK